MPTNRTAVAEQEGRMAEGKANGPCGCGCGDTLFFKPNRLSANGHYYFPGHEPRKAGILDTAPIPKATTVERWTQAGIGPEGRKQARETEETGGPEEA